MPRVDVRLLLRLVFSVLGLAFIALGVATMTKSGLGCTPIAAIPYAASLLFPQVSYGQWVMLFNFSLLGLEWLLLRYRLPLASAAAQCALTVVFGSCVDGFMFLIGDRMPDAYAGRLLGVLAGCVFIAAGATMGVMANLAVLPGDGLTMAVARVCGGEFGRIRIFSDSLMSATALGMCLWAFHEPLAVREGTVLAAVLTGVLVRFFMMALRKIRGKQG